MDETKAEILLDGIERLIAFAGNYEAWKVLVRHHMLDPYSSPEMLSDWTVVKHIIERALMERP